MNEPANGPDLLPPLKVNDDLSQILRFEDTDRLGVEGRKTDTECRTDETREDIDTGLEGSLFWEFETGGICCLFNATVPVPIFKGSCEK